MKPDHRNRISILAVTVGLAANIFLAAIKIFFGIAGHSPALLADGINSTSDVAYGIAMTMFMRISGKPPDDEHPYGHRQMETIAAVMVGAFVITTAIAIFWNSVDSVYTWFIGENDFGGASMTALWVATGTIAVKTLLAFWTLRIGRSTRNPAVTALGFDHRNDILSAAAATVGIYFGRRGFPWVDPLAGALVSLIILRTGIDILRESTSNLMDTLPGKELEAQIRKVAGSITGVEAVDEVHAHRFGPYLVANITLCVDGDITVAQGNAIANRVEKALMGHIDFMQKVHVHYHPISRKKP